ncbi:MAG: NnrU family protein [Myxococcota bacterium]
MVILSIGVALFMGMHLVPSVPAVRERIINRVGFGAYRGLFSLAAVVGLVLIVLGMRWAPTVPMWTPPGWGFTAAVVGMPLAFVFLAASYLPTNLKRWVRHPMLTAVAIWAGLHLLCNGDLASLILFGSFGAFAIFDIVSANRRGTVHAGDPVAGWRDLIPIAGGLLVYFLVLHYHQALFGRSVLPFWKALWT